MTIIFELDQLQELIYNFIDRVPRILEKSTITNDLSIQVDRLIELTESPFTLAVVGQMRVGKSTLINSLVGQDLAVVGVNETTATINFFKYDQDKNKHTFRVHWKDKPPQNFTLEKIDKWVGNSVLAKNTKYLEFFCDSDFLKDIYLVDTPGTRSVIEGHAETIDEFLSEKRERETFYYGGKADAILYVIGPVAREADARLLEEFENVTRIPGSSPFNSIAVVHKWETIESEDVVQEKQRKCSIIKNQLRNHVSNVIPYSGPMAMAAKKLHPEFWSDLTSFLSNVDTSRLKRALERGEQRFLNKYDHGGKLYSRSRMPWPSFRAMMKLAINNSITDSHKLRSYIDDISGYDILLSDIYDRLIKRTRLIKVFTLLNKSLTPYHVAKLRFDLELKAKSKLLKETEQAVSSVQDAIDGGLNFLQPTLNILKRIKGTLKSEIQSIIQIKSELESQAGKLLDSFNDFNRDVEAIRIIDDGLIFLDDSELFEIRAILGCYGFSAEERLSSYTEFADLLYHIDRRIDYFNDKSGKSTGEGKIFYDHLTFRLEQLAAYIEKHAE